jgi:hypothetical protein
MVMFALLAASYCAEAPIFPAPTPGVWGCLAPATTTTTDEWVAEATVVEEVVKEVEEVEDK